MGEADRAVVALDHVRGDRRLEHACRNARPLKERLRRRPQRRGERERLARGRGQSGESRTHELFERLRNRERLERVDVLVENAGQLQRKERIPARRLVDAEQRLPRERPAESVAKQPMERADAERPNRQPLDSLRTERLLDPRRLPSVDEPPGEQHSTGLAASLRSANASALDEDGSSHWTSSTAIRIGSRSLRRCSTSRTATASAR